MMGIIKLGGCILALVAANTWGMSDNTLAKLCRDAITLDTTLAMQSLQTPGRDTPQYHYFLNIFRLTEEQVAPIVKHYKQYPDDAQLMVQSPLQPDRRYLDSCMSNPDFFIPNYEYLELIYK